MASFSPDNSAQQLPYVLVQYLFKGPEHEVKRILPHGNANRKSSYKTAFTKHKGQAKTFNYGKGRRKKKLWTRFMFLLVMLQWPVWQMSCLEDPMTYTTPDILQDRRTPLASNQATAPVMQKNVLQLTM